VLAGIALNESNVDIIPDAARHRQRFPIMRVGGLRADDNAEVRPNQFGAKPSGTCKGFWAHAANAKSPHLQTRSSDQIKATVLGGESTRQRCSSLEFCAESGYMAIWIPDLLYWGNF